MMVNASRVYPDIICLRHLQSKQLVLLAQIMQSVLEGIRSVLNKDTGDQVRLVLILFDVTSSLHVWDQDKFNMFLKDNVKVDIMEYYVLNAKLDTYEIKTFSAQSVLRGGKI